MGVDVHLATRKVIQQIDTKVVGLHRSIFTPDGKYVCIVSVTTGELLFYNSKTGKEIRRINVGQGAAMLMDKIKTDFLYFVYQMTLFL